MVKRPVVLVIIDGFGHSDNPIGNAVTMAHTPTLDGWAKRYPHTLLQASGDIVGLDWGEPGNSEVGHLNIGAGRIVQYYSAIIKSAIADRSFFSNPALLSALKNAQAKQTKLHLIGMLTAGAVHASFEHIVALLELIKLEKISVPVRLHLFTDGKDSSPKEGESLLGRLNTYLPPLPAGQVKVVSIIGRNLAMDRNNRWQLTQQAYDLWVHGRGEASEDLVASLRRYYQADYTDITIPPTVLANESTATVEDGDSIIFFNFREDSMRQVASSFIQPEFKRFATKPLPNSSITTFTAYLDTQTAAVAFGPYPVTNGLAEWVSAQGKTQLHVAESEKYAHVTLFFNGLHNQAYPGETDFLLESPADLLANPEMRSQDITAKVVADLENRFHDLIVVNFANADLLSHLGNINLVVKGISKIDQSLASIYEVVKKQDAIMVVTADHGNAESLIYGTSGEIETKHNQNPVPLYLIASQYADQSKLPLATSGILADVAPTILELMKLPIPAEMTGQSILRLLSTSQDAAAQ